MNRYLSFRTVGVGFSVACPDAGIGGLIQANFGAMEGAPDATSPLKYQIERDTDTPGLFIRRQQEDGTSLPVVERDGSLSERAIRPNDLLYALEGDLVIELQKLRSELLFLHAASLEWKGRVSLLIAESGGGKSTTAWALLHHGMGYLSDELSPVDLASLTVQSYPHALCVKARPPVPYDLPPEAVDLGRTLHVPVSQLPGTLQPGPLPLGAIFFVNFVSASSLPSIEPLDAAGTAMRLYANVLNALAHANSGLDATVRLAETLPAFLVNTGQLAPTCALILDTLAKLEGSPTRCSTD